MPKVSKAPGNAQNKFAKDVTETLDEYSKAYDEWCLAEGKDPQSLWFRMLVDTVVLPYSHTTVFSKSTTRSQAPSTQTEERGWQN